MSFLLEGLRLLVWQASWLHASGAAIAYALLIYVALFWATWVLTRALLDVDFDFHWQTPMWLRHLFFWGGFLSFVAMGAALGWRLNQLPVYAEDEPLMIFGAGIGAVFFQFLYRRLVRARAHPR